MSVGQRNSKCLWDSGHGGLRMIGAAGPGVHGDQRVRADDEERRPAGQS